MVDERVVFGVVVESLQKEKGDTRKRCQWVV
jgi:hypothetical protein